MKKTCYIEMNWNELDELIEEKLGRDYNVVAYEEWGNDESHTFDVEKGELDEWDRADFSDFVEGRRVKSFRTRVLLQEMCNLGLIDEGQYLINVSW